MNQNQPLSAGFADPVHDAQTAFRRVLDALSRPGRRFVLGGAVPGLALGPAMAHLLLALTDDDTPVWWQREEGGAPDWLRFHTGAGRAAAPQEAAFAVLVDAGAMPPLDSFAPGSAEAPERSATLLVEVPSLDDGPAVEWRGPGIQDMQTVRIAGLPDHFWTQWQVNHAAFPQGVDIVFTCADLALGLPRTTRVRRLEGI
ncbi:MULTISPECIES: phosphonate C-P lyase system protein PhnH [unclassified Polaromonas]|jgi:alpha-D-ribose 1-methylphosphonate 5-triphosphate synthase subunit PhnH|uniref:phosphonate C-P lyase system protein PhnH n=1 Tax=unclassified Polaromonas TaxID=2638319 RepID=UPI000BD0666F|nr:MULTISPECIES: phosphonate C-P lyase system protein PhnH [unclassified Polaromonas]OYY39676.1 MAG: phosphonate C-P lyase system protein PhnH [Polaromonas sp. 35-63-35]OYZ22421.1 MAG: phosphonate C-P lyase system protein PhnH [Polaromonas sp. 16-63-31]OYZ81359.1 MAG: phosphonate C-P lyase system protein PhnH [Polaromonas sp. 24-63-21]OZA52416.1 MAG: phosphonate C-P lyase system protein PhnH [Polaromonas sp. 17-63-33]OZA88720.1 MAG: phosphonate C-P lyase system protein PhnH [Polaromonas sp. 39